MAKVAANRPDNFWISLSGHDDPGMFGRMFPNLEPLAVDDGPLQELADAMKDANSGRRRRQQHQDPGGVHLSRAVRRPRHHARSHLVRRQGIRSRPRSRISARRRSISTASTASVPMAAGSFMHAIPAMPTARRRAETSDRQDHQRTARRCNHHRRATICRAALKASR